MTFFSRFWRLRHRDHSTIRKREDQRFVFHRFNTAWTVGFFLIAGCQSSHVSDSQLFGSHLQGTRPWGDGICDEALAIRLVPEVSSQSTHPYHLQAASSSEAIPIELTQSHGVVQIHTKINLRDLSSSLVNHQKDLFFVWSDRVCGYSVVSASYSYRIFDSVMGWRGSDRPQLAWSDPSEHRWMIPVSELPRLIEGLSEHDISFEQEQVLRVDLVLENSQRKSFEIKFQAAGPLPQLVSEEISVQSQYSGVSAQQIASQFARQGVEVYREKLRNESQRKVKVWLSADTQAYVMSHLIEMREKRTRSGEVVRSQLFLSQAAAHLGGWSIKRGQRPEERVLFPSSGWSSFELDSREEVEVGWWAAPQGAPVQCSLPERVVLPSAVPEFRQVPFNPVLYPGDTISVLIDPMTYGQTLEWTLDRFQLQGQWKHHVRVSHLGGSQDLVVGDDPRSSESVVNPYQNFRLIHDDEKNLKHGVEMDLVHLSRLNCQGVFP